MCPRAFVVRSSVVVVVHDDDAVAREVDVELEPVGAERQAVVERRERVLRPQRRRRRGARRRAAATRSARENSAKALILAGRADVRCRMASPSSSSSRSGHGSDDRPRTLGQLRSDVASGRTRAAQRQGRDPREPDRAPAHRRDGSFRASSASTTPSCRRSSTRSCRGTTSSCSACAARRRAASCERSRDLLDDVIPVVPGCEIHDDPLEPGVRLLPGARAGGRGRRPAGRVARSRRRYVEKLATPDVTIADLIGDLDPIKAARSGLQLSDELTMHYGLLPRANRGVFAINELPDLAGKVQVGLFNILQEGDVQIKGYPVRLPLDVMLVFSANPEDYTARGKIITPLKDRIGSEIRTHYPATRQHAMAITAQEAWVERGGCEIEVAGVRPRGRRGSRVPGAAGPEDRQALRRQPAPADLAARERRLERRAARDPAPTSRSSCRASPTSMRRCPPLPVSSSSSTEGELRGADNVARDIIRSAVGNVFTGYFAGVELKQVTDWFDLGGTCRSTTRWRRPSCSSGPAQVQGLRELAAHAGVADQAPVAGSSRPPSTSSSRGCTRRRRSAARTSSSTRAPSSRGGRRATVADRADASIATSRSRGTRRSIQLTSAISSELSAIS